MRLYWDWEQGQSNGMYYILPLMTWRFNDLMFSVKEDVLISQGGRTHSKKGIILGEVPRLHQRFECCWPKTTSSVGAAWRSASHERKNKTGESSIRHWQDKRQIYKGPSHRWRQGQMVDRRNKYPVRNLLSLSLLSSQTCEWGIPVGLKGILM